MNSVFKHREDKSDETLSRLTDGWNGNKNRNIFQRKQKPSQNQARDFGPGVNQSCSGFDTGSVEALGGQFKDCIEEFETKSISDEPNIHLSKDCDAFATKTLTRLSREWAGKNASNLPATNEAQEEISLEKLNLTQTLSSNDKETRHHIDEEMAPSLLVDWKIWGIKITVLVLIPIFLVLGGGTRHISNISPELAKYCHTQALVMQESFEGKSSINAAANHIALAEIYLKQKDSRLAVDHAHKAAKIYAYDCLNTINFKSTGDWKKPFTRTRDLEPSLTKLRESLVLAALASKQRKYISLSNTYWKLAVSLDPAVVPDMKTSNMLIANRLQAAESLAQQRNPKETIKVLNNAFKVLPFEDVRTIYYCYNFENTEVSDESLAAFEKAIELHYALAKYHRTFGNHKAHYENLNIAESLYKHLASFHAIRELDNKVTWNSKWYKAKELSASFFISKDYVSGIEVGPYNKSNQIGRKYIKKQINKELNGNPFLSRKSKFKNFLETKHPNVRIELVFNKTGFQMKDDQRNELSDSPYMKLNKINRYTSKDFRKALVKVSRSLK